MAFFSQFCCNCLFFFQYAIFKYLQLFARSLQKFGHWHQSIPAWFKQVIWCSDQRFNSHSPKADPEHYQDNYTNGNGNCKNNTLCARYVKINNKPVTHGRLNAKINNNNCSNLYSNCSNRIQANYTLKVNDFDNLSGNEDTLNYCQLSAQSFNVGGNYCHYQTKEEQEQPSSRWNSCTWRHRVTIPLSKCTRLTLLMWNSICIWQLLYYLSQDLSTKSYRHKNKLEMFLVLFFYSWLFYLIFIYFYYSVNLCGLMTIISITMIVWILFKYYTALN